MTLPAFPPEEVHGERRALAVISVHASPLGRLGRGENGGMNQVVRRLCAGLAALGVPSDVFVRRDDRTSPAEELIAPGSRLVRIVAGPERPLPKDDLLAHLPEFADGLLQHARSEQRRYRLVHAHYWLSGWVGRRVASRWRVPMVQSFHTLARMKLAAGVPTSSTRAEVEAILVRTADRIVALSAGEARALVRHYGADPERVCVVPPGVDVEEFAPRPTAGLRRQLGLLGRRIVLYAGRLERLKGTDFLLEAVARLLARPGYEDVTLLVAGDDSGDGRRQSDHPRGERGRLEALAAALGIADHVRFLGALEPSRLADLYALADVCAVPSRAETFGLVALEAQASATPVVATAVGGLVDVVVDGETGLLVPGRDPERFAAALALILDDADLRERLGEAGRRRAKGLTWSHAAQRILELYECVEQGPEAVGERACACL